MNSLEYRGNDAAGVALINRDGRILVYKDHEPAWTVTGQAGYRKFIDENLNADILTALVHTRKATKGNPFQNKNNHPLIKDAGVVVHNGMLHNDDRLFESLKLERGAETDSDIIRAILDQHNGVNPESLAAMSQVTGSVASALVHPADPTKLMLLRSGNPLVIGNDGNYLYFASDKRAIYRAARPWIWRHGLPMQLQAPNLAFLSMPNDSGYIFDMKGLELHDKFSSSGTFKYRYANYNDVYSPNGRESRRAFQRAEAERKVSENRDSTPLMITGAATSEVTNLPVLPRRGSVPDFTVLDFVRCPNLDCEEMLALSEEQKTIINQHGLSRLRCKKCKTTLNGAMKSTRVVQKAASV